MRPLRDVLQVLRVIAAGRDFALEVAVVQGIERPSRWARLPGAPAYVRGVAEARDQAVAVVDLAARLQLLAAASSAEGDVVLIESDEPVGLAVERVVGVEEVDPAGLVRPEGAAAAGLRGCTREGLLLLDAEALVDGRALHPLAGLPLPAAARP